MKNFLYCLLFVLITFQIPAYSQSQFKLKKFRSETFSAKNISLTTIRTALPASELGVIVNILDPQSVSVGNYYKTTRNIPTKNMIYVSFPPGNNNMPYDEFNTLRSEVLSKTPQNVQAYAITWTTPWKVDCMSITSAFAFGFNEAYCQPLNGQECNTTQESIYFDSNSKQPRKDLNIIPSMMLAGLDFLKVKSVIDRGKLSDNSFPIGDGYLFTTTDIYRNVRKDIFDVTASIWNHPQESLNITHIDNSDGHQLDYLENVQNILFYFTGTYIVQGLNTLGFVPGSVADHLTSYGGALTAGYNASQMPILDWLEHGVTGSYGTVVEPCSYTTKFTDPNILFYYYFSGESLIESYWKSINMPGEGLFVGEPLAKPWGTKIKNLQSGEIEIKTSTLLPGKTYHLLRPARTNSRNYVSVQKITPSISKFHTITFRPTNTQYYLLSESELEPASR